MISGKYSQPSTKMLHFCRRHMVKRSSVPYHRFLSYQRYMANLNAPGRGATTTATAARSRRTTREAVRRLEQREFIAVQVLSRGRRAAFSRRRQEQQQQRRERSATTSPTIEPPAAVINVANGRDDIGDFFRSLYASVQRLAPENIARMKDYISQEIWRMQMLEFVERLQAINDVM